MQFTMKYNYQFSSNNHPIVYAGHFHEYDGRIINPYAAGG